MFLVAGARAAAADELRIATLAPEGSAWMKILSKGAEEVASSTGGRVTWCSGRPRVVPRGQARAAPARGTVIGSSCHRAG